MYFASLDALGWGILIFVGLLFGIPYTRFILRIRAISKWPLAEARISETGVARGLPGGYGYFLAYRCAITYRYEVEGQGYTGQFGLRAGNPEAASDLATRTLGTAVEIRYNPRHPKDSVPVNKEILGRPVLLRYTWLNPRVW